MRCDHLCARPCRNRFKPNRPPGRLLDRYFLQTLKDKEEAFLEVYEVWVSSEWTAISAAVESAISNEDLARRLVTLSIAYHSRWKGLRASLLELVYTDLAVKRFYCAQRNRQLDIIAELRAKRGLQPRSREQDAIRLFTTERAYDAIGRGETKDLGLDRKTLIEEMVKNVEAMLL